MEAIILAGGLGTRLRSMVTEVPKPMAPVQGRPFLAYIIDGIKKQGVDRVILSVGHKHELIADYFGFSYRGVEMIYSIEETPLGTGGGVRQALSMATTATPLIVNGDTLFVVDLQKMVDHHVSKRAMLTLALKPMKQFDRYGVVGVDVAGRVNRFQEKGSHTSGLINGGIYVANKTLFEGFSLGERFSFEEFMQNHVAKILFSGFVSDGYFVDIGIPEDYERAQREII